MRLKKQIDVLLLSACSQDGNNAKIARVSRTISFAKHSIPLRDGHR